jgi:hypothetical protein
LGYVSIPTAYIEQRATWRESPQYIQDAIIPVSKPERIFLHPETNLVSLFWIGNPRLISGYPDPIFFGN